jgi:hypothetical protein
MKMKCFKQELEEVYLTELVRSAVEYQTAIKVAGILAAEKPDEHLTGEEAQLVREACALWLKRRKRMTFISEVINSVSGVAEGERQAEGVLKSRGRDYPIATTTSRQWLG